MGIAADAIWAIAFVVPSLFTMLTGKELTTSDPILSLFMGISASVYAGWTLLLLWAVKKPVERRMVMLLTVIVIAGIFAASIRSIFDGYEMGIWIPIKMFVLAISMLISYFMAGQEARNNG